jgi:hypothetical protein
LIPDPRGADQTPLRAYGVIEKHHGLHLLEFQVRSRCLMGHSLSSVVPMAAVMVP